MPNIKNTNGISIPMISKSKYMDGLSCSKLFWCHFNAPELILPPDASVQAILEQGKEVGDWAKKQYSKGVEIALGNDAILNTKTLFSKRVPIFEGSFAFNGCYCKVDILVPVSKNEWDVIEVKSSTEVKEEHVEDVAFQLYVLQGCKLNVRKVYVMVLNKGYVRKGGIDVKNLFVKEDVTLQVKEKIA